MGYSNDKDGANYLQYQSTFEPGLLIDDKYFQMGVKQIKARMLPQLEVEIQ